MGVRGLTTYINYNQNSFLDQYFLHGCNLVIDGHSLCAQLYRHLNCFSAFGGDYDKFASHTRNFFKNLRKCNVTSFILFDGSYESRKLRTAYSRLRSKINGASRLDPVTQGSLQIFPLLLRDVFKEVLTEMDIAFTVCEFEADDEIAAMARHLNCPVLSYDSDFFIYNVLYIPFNTLDFKPKAIEVDETKCYALECKIYRVEKLTEQFGGLQEEMLPLLATLLGNDYVEKRVFNKFFAQLKMPKSRRKVNEQQRCIHGLFRWLQNETLDSAITKILGRLKKDQKRKVFAIIKKSITGYNNKHCNSLKYFNITESTDTSVTLEHLEMPDEGTVSEEDSTSESNDESNDCNSTDTENEEQISEEFIENGVDGTDDKPALPEWLGKGIRNKSIPHSYINLYTHHLHFCSPQAEDYSEEDAFLCTLPILRYAFDLITDFAHESCTYVSRERNNNYKRISVEEELAIPRLFETPFRDLSDDELKSCFHHLLKEKLTNLDLDTIALLPSNFQLYMIALLWWVTQCNVPLNLVHSLLICYTMLEAIDEKLGMPRGANYFNNKYAKKVEEAKKRMSQSNESETQEVFLNKNKVQYEDCLIASSVLLKHFEMDDSIHKRPKSYDTKRMHSIAQFQCCLQQLNCLNTLCREPFETIQYSKCFSGTFVYNVALKLENQSEPKVFLEQYLKGANTVLLFYKSLCTVYENCATKMCLSTTKGCGKKSRRGGRTKKKVGHEIDEIDFIVKGFASEVVI